MQFTVSSGALTSRLQTLQRVISNKNTISILECFLFEVADGMLTITASDSENVMQMTVELDECSGDGRFAIPNLKVLNAVKELAEQPLRFSIDESAYTVEIDYQNGTFNLTAVSAEDYPMIVESGKEMAELQIPSQLFAEDLSRSLFAVASDDLHPVMNGVYFDFNADNLTIVATDGRKLVRNRVLTLNADTPSSFILPQKPAALLKQVLAKTDDDTVISYCDNSAEVEFPGGKLYCRLIEGRYPNYNSVIPTVNTNCATIDRKSLLGAIKRVLPFASESSSLVRFHVEEGSLLVSAEDVDFATSAKETLTCEYTGVKMDIGFNGSTIYDMLNNLISDEVIIKLADPSRAGILEPAVQPEGQDILMLIMPMLLNE